MIEITELTMDGTLKEYTVPENTYSLGLHIKGADVDMKTSAVSDVWTIKDGEKESIDARTISGEKIYFTGPTGAKVQIRRLTGLLS